ncbi:MAG: hypothetical protein R2770_02975 [Acidimicrobiales bacterium]
MRKKAWLRILALLAIFGMLAAACGDSDDSDSADGGGTTETTAEGGSSDNTAPATDIATDLSGVCPSPLVIQTDWHPEAEHGALYEMIGDGYELDTENLIVRGPGQLGGQPLGIDIEVRAGGPAIGFNPPRVNMYTDDSIHIGYANIESSTTAFDDTPLIAVASPLEKNPQMVMWDPQTYPDVQTLEDVGEAGMAINLFGLDGFPEYFVAAGIWSQDQLDPSYDGTPARFIAEGDIAQQGFASAEPWSYLNNFEQFGRDVAFQLLHDAGWTGYSQTLSVKPDDLEELRPCLELFIPVVQQSVINFATDPARANAIIVDAVASNDAGWVYPAELAEWSVGQQIALGLVGNGPDGIVANMDEARIQETIDAQALAGVDLPEGLTAADLFTNEFIDPNIGFPAGFGGGDDAAAGGDSDDMAMDYDLSGVCPSPLVIQTDWHPEAEHGALYEMIGDGYELDTENLIVRGPGQLGGQPLGIDIEVRAGGPAIGFNPPRVNMYTDDSIHIGYANIESSTTAFDDTPLIAVAAPLEKNPQMVMWDPQTYPDVQTLEDVGEAGMAINLFGLDGFPEYFVAAGIWSQDQLDPSYDGTPARFIAEGDIAQQGFASAEPWSYLNNFEQFGRDVAFQLLHDAGWTGYSQTLSVKPDDLEELRPCLELFIPVVQQSVINFATDPARANAIIVDAVASNDAGWVYPAELAEWSVGQQIALGLVGNGPDGIVANMDEARIQETIDAQALAGVDLPEGLTAADLFTNEFIDPNIGFPADFGG